ncbi:MAG: hypothetical protein IPF99_21425 [Deltaproteobacteria bacterium]|nr:hypothetical protein [Deltaproteobacteria bacterium]
MNRPRTLLLAPLLLLAATGCGDAPLDRDREDDYPNHNAPLARIEGTLLYEGPVPSLDREGTPLGRVVLLLFRSDNQPPPQGLATTAESVQTLPASQVFRSLIPTAGGAVRASVPFVFPNITAAGVYQLRAFYSNRDERTGFHPIYGVRSQPVRGDVGGGAVLDPRAAAPTFVNIPVGVPNGNGGYTLPETGAVTSNVTVFLGAPITEDRPIFHVSPSPPDRGQTLTPVAFEPRPAAPGAAQVTYASRTGFIAPESRAYELPSNVPATDVLGFLGALPTLTLNGALPEAEVQPAANAGVLFGNPISFALGTVYRAQHPTLFAPNLAGGEPPVLRFPWVFPLAIMVKLHEPSAEERAVLSSASPDPLALARVVSALNLPERAPGTVPVVIFGSVAPNTGLQDFASIVRPSPAPPVVQPSVRVVFPPVAFEIRGSNPERDWAAVVPKLPAPIAAAAGPLPPGSRCAGDRGLPSGRYSLTIVTARGATWSLPNELAPHSFPGRVAGAAVTSAASQGAVIRVVPSMPAAGNVCPAGIPSD